MIKAILFITAIFSVITITSSDDEKSLYSQINEWGLKGKVKVLVGYYYHDLMGEGNELQPQSVDDWDRKTITHYNEKGMIDSIKSFNSFNSTPSVMLFQMKNDTIWTLNVMNSDTVVFSKKYWISESEYISEIFDNNKLVGKEYFSLDQLFRVKELRSEYYASDQQTVEHSSIQKVYFNDESHLDSTRIITQSLFRELTTNRDLEFDEFNNPIRSVKQIDNNAPWIILREFGYYEQ